MPPNDNIRDDENSSDNTEETNLDNNRDQETPTPPVQENMDPPTRGEQKENSRRYYEQRQNRKKSEKLNEDEDEDEDEEIRRANSIIDRRIKEQLGNKMEEINIQHTKIQVNNFLADKPQYNEVREKIERFAMHPSRTSIPIETIALECLGYDAIKRQGIEEYKESIKEKEDSMIGGDYTEGGDENYLDQENLPAGFGNDE